MDKLTPQLILASTSPTRHRLLHNAGINFAVQPPHANEEDLKRAYGGQPEHLALHLAMAKATSIANSGNAYVLGADQTLICDGTLFNKPRSLAEARDHLLKLCGRTHTLQSALAIAQHQSIVWTHVSEAHLTMRSFTAAFLETYLASLDQTVLGSVGCYQIEGQGIQLFETVAAAQDVILGLPLIPLLKFLRQQGMMVQ